MKRRRIPLPLEPIVKMSEKIQKVLARAGLGSRRELETWISAGRVSVNGKIATLGDRAESEDVIRVDGHVVRTQAPEEMVRRVIMYHKPAGEVCSRNDPEGRPTVFDNLPRLKGMRWVQVGRLDINTSGLLLFTTDGELMLEDGMSRFKSIGDAGGAEEGANHWYKVSLVGGKYREVRRLFESQDLEVARLIRVRFGNIPLPPQLRQGRWMDLPPEQMGELAGKVDLKGKQYTGLYGRARLRTQRSGDKPPRKPRRNPYRR